MYKTRILVIGDRYFVEYKWAGGFLYGRLTCKAMTWTRWASNTAYSSLDEAKKAEERAQKSYQLNHGWNEKMVD